MQKFLIVLLFLSSFCFAQKTENDAIKESVENLFAGMKNADTVMIKSVFANNAILQTITKSDAVKTEKL